MTKGEFFRFSFYIGGDNINELPVVEYRFKSPEYIEEIENYKLGDVICYIDRLGKKVIGKVCYLTKKSIFLENGIRIKKKSGNVYANTNALPVKEN